MHIFIPAYVFLALASWSALAAPLSVSERDNEHAQKRSILTGRQPQINDFGPGLASLYVIPPDSGSGQPTMMDCGSGTDPNSDLNSNLITNPNPNLIAGSNLNSNYNPDDGGDGGDGGGDGKHKNDDKDDDHKAGDNTNGNNNFANTIPGPGLPVIARRRFRSPMRRDGKALPSIFERDDPPTARNPITVGDIVAQYLKQRAASRKRAVGPKTRRRYN